MKGRFMAAAAVLVAAFALGGGAVAAGAADVAPEPKEAAPALEKLVLENSTDTWGTVADADVGEDVSFRIRVSLPAHILEHDRVRCRIVDALPDSMEPDIDSVVVTCADEDLSTSFELSFDGGILALEADSLAGLGLEGDCELDIAYTARLTATSPVGEGGSVNSAWLELEADGEELTTPASQTAVFTYRLIVTKVDAANHATTLAGARFVLGRKDGLFAVVSGGRLTEWTKNESEATRLETDTSGRISIAGLDAGVYTLAEVSPPSGYQGLPESTEFEIRSALSFDVAADKGRIDTLEIASGSASSPGNAKRGEVYCMVENAQLPTRIVPTTGDPTQDPWGFAAFGAALAAGALIVRKRLKRVARPRKHQPAHLAACLLLFVACFFNHVACMPLRALAQEPEALVLGASSDSETEPVSDGPSGIGVPVSPTRSSAPVLRSTARGATVGVSSEADIPRSTTNSYINVLNMSYENAYVMVNDTADFAYSGSSPTNTYINWSFGQTDYVGTTGQSISSMVLYRGAPGAHGAGTDTWGIDTIADTTGKGLVSVWFKDAGVLSDTGEPVSMLLKLEQYQVMPNYVDYYAYMSGGTYHETSSTYRQYRNAGYSDVPLLYIFKSAGADQTNPANARVWMHAIWCSGQIWSVSFYKSSAVPSGFNASTGYSINTLDLSDDLLVSTATNGETYLARQYCYDLDTAGIRWLDRDGTYSASSPVNTPGNSLYNNGGAYLTQAGAESFAWISGTSGSSYISASSNLKNDSYGGLTYWLHDYNKTAGGTQTGYRWLSSGPNHNTDWRNALASDILPSSTFAWVGTDCSTGINLNSQFTGTGSLQVSKAVSDGSTRSFPFTVTLESPSYSSGSLTWTELSGAFDYSVTGSGGAIVGNGSLRSGDTVNLAAGQTLVVADLPEGTRYTVTEGSHAGYQPTQTNSTEPIAANEFSGTIVNGVTSEIDITNVRLLAPASWSIVKKGNTGELLANAEFTVRYYAGSVGGTPTKSWVIKTDAEGRAALDAAHLVSGDGFYVEGGVVGLPLGTVTVEETRAPEGYERDASVRGYEIRDVGGALECTIPNELVVENERIVGSLAISKELRGTGADGNREFSFSVGLTLDGAPLNGTFGGETFVDGVASFVLKAGQTKTISGIPAGSGYEVSEAEAPGYNVTWSGNTGTIVAGSTASAVATNTYAASGSVRIQLTKRFDTNGPELAEGQFSFELHEDAPDGTVVDSTSCGADGNVVFELGFDQETIGRTLIYYVTEVDDGQAGVIYDTHAAKVEVRVSDNGDGTLAADISYTDAEFSNSYRSYVLPSTGLGGVAGTAAFGVTLAAGTALVLARSRRLRRA